MPTALELQQLLREAGLRVTSPRVAVLIAVHAHPHADTDSVIEAVRAALIRRVSSSPALQALIEIHLRPSGAYQRSSGVGDAEMLTEIRIPRRPGGSSAYEKVERRAGDWAVVSSGVAVWLEDGRISEARVGLAAVGPNTTGIPAISDAMRGQPPSEDLYAEAGRIAAENCDPVTDMRGSAGYKRHLAKELTRRTLRRAVERIGGN